MINDIQKEILKLKKEKDICILAHCYQTPEILEVADFVGDSFALSVEASKVSNKTVIMCGVRFMAETVKILSPDKKVILSNQSAGCPMAEMISKDTIIQLKKEHPDYAVVCVMILALKTEVHHSDKEQGTPGKHQDAQGGGTAGSRDSCQLYLLGFRCTTQVSGFTM